MIRAYALGSIVLLLSLPLSAAFANETESLQISQLKVGPQFDVRTAHRTYRSELVTRSTGECRMWASWDGEAFSAERKVYLLGATRGPQAGFTLVVMQEIKVGQKMELGIGGLEAKNRYLSSPVKSIKVYEGNEQLALSR